jgi:putative sterol carrier protein
MAIASIQEALKNFSSIDPAKIKDMDAVILFDLSGEGGGKWTLKVADGKADLDKGETAPPSMTLSMSASDFIALANGELNAMAAFMQGKIKVSGDMSLAMRLQSLLA